MVKNPKLFKLFIIISLGWMEDVDKPFPVDYLPIIPGTLGYNLGAGLFKNK